MKDVAVYAGRTQMLQGAGNILAYLRGEIAIRIIWEAVILAALICKLRLKKKIFAFNYARGDRSPQCSADSDCPSGRVCDRVDGGFCVGQQTFRSYDGTDCELHVHHRGTHRDRDGLVRPMIGEPETLLDRVADPLGEIAGMRGIAAREQHCNRVFRMARDPIVLPEPERSLVLLKPTMAVPHAGHV